MRRLEALADAIAKYTGYHSPDSEAYQTRNPGLLKAWSVRHPRTDSGVRVFDSHIDGYQALLFDLKIKAVGKSRYHLTGDSTLLDLMHAYQFPPTMAGFLVKFLRQALPDDATAETSTLNFFMES